MGGYICHDTFDYTSVTRLLELVTGVTNPNISACHAAAPVRRTGNSVTQVPDRRGSGRYDLICSGMSVANAADRGCSAA
jgi:hypothetical protein